MLKLDGHAGSKSQWDEGGGARERRWPTWVENEQKEVKWKGGNLRQVTSHGGSVPKAESASLSHCAPLSYFTCQNPPVFRP